jgi:hypothetical protein
MEEKKREKEMEYTKSERMHLKILCTTIKRGTRLNIAPAHLAGNSARSLGLSKDQTKLRGFYSTSELYRLSDRLLSAKLVPTFAGRGCRVVSATDPPGR